MNAESREFAPFALFIGDTLTADTLRREIEAGGGVMYHPQSLMEALGCYITYLPNVIIIDMCAPFAAEAYMHLRSVDAHPILLLLDVNAPIPEREGGVSWLPRDVTLLEIYRAICKLNAEVIGSVPVVCAIPAYNEEKPADTITFVN
jgi:hypothetical protein